jgi:hypothetical protein
MQLAPPPLAGKVRMDVQPAVAMGNMRRPVVVHFQGVGIEQQLALLGLEPVPAECAEHERARSEFLQRAETRVLTSARRTRTCAFRRQPTASATRSTSCKPATPCSRPSATSGRDQFGAFVRPLMQSHPYLDAVVFHRLVEAGGRAPTKPRRARSRPRLPDPRTRRAA